MEVRDTFIEGLKIIHLNKISDNRGEFTKIFNEDFYLKNKLQINFKESYFSISKKGVIRGMHFQTQPHQHTKMVFVNSGSIQDVVLDIRSSSKTYGKYFEITIDSVNSPILVYIPIGCAHGFKSLEDNTIVTYLQTSCYNKESDEGIRYDSFGFNWDILNPIVSERDQSFLSFDNYKTNF